MDAPSAARLTASQPSFADALVSYASPEATISILAPLPSLLMVSRDLTKVLNERYPGEPQTRDYLDQLTSLASAS